LARSFSLLIHVRIEAQIRSFVEQLPKSEKDQIVTQIHTAFQKLKSDPTGSQNVLFHENRNPALVGKVRKMYVGGNEGYRLMNLVLTDKAVILPFYMSDVKRSLFNYGSVNWDIANEIQSDFLSGNIKKFKQI